MLRNAVFPRNRNCFLNTFDGVHPLLIIIGFPKAANSSTKGSSLHSPDPILNAALTSHLIQTILRPSLRALEMMSQQFKICQVLDE